MIRALVVMVLGAGVTGACGREEEPAPALVVPPAGAAATSAGTVPHGDHNPHFGGLVLMNGDLHFEVVLTRDGSARVYFRAATRAELPAAAAGGGGPPRGAGAQQREEEGAQGGWGVPRRGGGGVGAGGGGGHPPPPP